MITGFQETVEGDIYVRNGGAIYKDTRENFAADYGQAAPALPEGATERLYEPDKRHMLGNGSGVVGGGDLPWKFGDDAIAACDTLLATQYARLNPPPTLEELKAAAHLAVEREFQNQIRAPIEHEVGGVTYEWHADDEAIQNIMGMVTLILAGAPVPNPRPWTPKGSMTPVEITHAELIGLGAAIAARKDSMFVEKKAKQADTAAMKDAAEVQAAIDGL